MNKKQYYNLIKHYNCIINTKQYNELYYDQNELDNIKSKLLTQLKTNKIHAEIELIKRKNSLYDDYSLKNIIDKIDYMINTILDEKIIEKDMYDKTYLNSYITINGIPIYIVVSLIISSVFLFLYMYIK